MRHTIISIIAAIIFTLLSANCFAGQRFIPGSPVQIGYDLSIKEGMVDYIGSGSNLKKSLEFVIKNRGLSTSPKTSVVFTRGKLKLTRSIPALKPGKVVRINFLFPQPAARYYATIRLKDRNLKNNRVSGIE